MALPRSHSAEDDEALVLRPFFFWLCCPCICSFRSLMWVWRTVVNKDADGEQVRPFRRLLIYLTFFILCTYIYVSNFAYFCRPAHMSRGTTRLLIFAQPKLEGNHKIEREGFLGEFWVAAEDLYLSHVVCNTVSQFRPTHVVVLGDIFSYQYLDFQEFARRARRYHAIFNLTTCLPLRTIRPVLVNVSGNSDIGYGLEMSRSTVTRYEQVFGKVNNEILTPGHTIVVYNSLNLDPATDQEMRRQTWALLETSTNAPQSVHERRLQNDLNVILLQHLPFARVESACGEPFTLRTTKDRFTVEQSHVSAASSHTALNLTRPVLVFSSHHPSGCTYEHGAGMREYTVRSVSSDYGGSSMVLDIYETQRGTYNYRVTSCSFITMRSFYLVMVLLVAWVSLVSLLLIELAATSQFWARMSAPRSPPPRGNRDTPEFTAPSPSSVPQPPASYATSRSQSSRKPKSFVRKNV